MSSHSPSPISQLPFAGACHRFPPPPQLARGPRRHSSGFLRRLEHMTFAWFTSSMSLGGVANLLISGIIDMPFLKLMGKIMFYLNLVYYFTLIVLQVVRFTCTSASILYTLRHPIECMFIPTAVLGSATLIVGTANLVGRDPAEWKEIFLRTVFWSYCFAAFLVSIVCFTFLFEHHEHNLHHMSPGWILPIFPLMLSGTVASSVIKTQETKGGLPIAICGLACQGLGFAVSCMMYSVLLLRFMTVGFPPAKTRLGLFMNCGPPAFTIICLLSLAKEMDRILPKEGYMGLPKDFIANVLVVGSIAASIGLWLISAWFYILTCTAIVVAVIKDVGQVTFILAWWAAVFPITGFVTATFLLGESINSQIVTGLAAVMVVWLLLLLIVIGTFQVEAVYRNRICYDGQDEDRVLDTMEERIYGASSQKEAYQPDQSRPMTQQNKCSESPHNNDHKNNFSANSSTTTLFNPPLYHFPSQSCYGCSEAVYPTWENEKVPKACSGQASPSPLHHHPLVPRSQHVCQPHQHMQISGGSPGSNRSFGDAYNSCNENGPSTSGQTTRHNSNASLRGVYSPTTTSQSQVHLPIEHSEPSGILVSGLPTHHRELYSGRLHHRKSSASASASTPAASPSSSSCFYQHQHSAAADLSQPQQPHCLRKDSQRVRPDHLKMTVLTHTQGCHDVDGHEDGHGPLRS